MRVRQPRFPISTTGQLLSLITFADDIGAPWWRALGRVRLPTEIVDPLGYLPTLNILRFTSDMARREGLPDLGYLVSQSGGAGAVHPLILQGIAQAPTLYAALQSVCERIGLQGSHVHVWLKHSHDNLWVCHIGSVPPSIPGTEQWEYLRVVEIIRVITRFLGEFWRPQRLHLASRQKPPQSMAAYMGGCEIRTGMPYGAIPIPMDLIARPSVNGFREVSRDSAPSYQAGVDYGDWLDRLKAVLPSYLAAGRLTLPLLAEMVGMSPRTLQRLLAERGTSHHELLETARFEEARRLLSDTNLTVTEVTRLAGYTDSSNFARAFRRLSGRSPVDYRKDCSPPT